MASETTGSTGGEQIVPGGGNGKGAASGETDYKVGEEIEKEEAVAGAEAEEKHRPLSPQEFRQYNRLAEHMDYFHNHFRQAWTRLYTAAMTNERPPGTSLRQFIDEGLQLISHLTAHHNIEETYLFPLLAKKMPEFQSGMSPKHFKAGVAAAAASGEAASGKKKSQAVLLQQHREIHAGMDVFEEYLRKCRSGETDFEMGVLKEKMDSWGTVLWEHLDLEVKTLGAENMRRYWTVEEMRKFLM